MKPFVSLSVTVCSTASHIFFYQVFLCAVLFVLLVMPCFLLANMVPDRILSVNASIDTIGEILLKIIPTLEEVRHHIVRNAYVNRLQSRIEMSIKTVVC